MNTQLKRVKVECAVLRNHDFAVEHTTRRQLLQQRIDQFWKVSIERLLVTTLNHDFFAIAKNERAKSIPFRFEDPISGPGQIADSFREHWQDRRVNWELHNLRSRLHGFVPDYTDRA